MIALLSKRGLILLILLLILGVSLALGACIGAVSLSGEALLGVLGLGDGATPLEETLFWTLRAPRVVGGALVGASLACAGAALQGIFRNPLADPGLIGVSSGAAVAVVAVIVFGRELAGWMSGVTGGALGMETVVMPGAAFLGALLATLAVVRLGTRGGRVEVATMILAGVAINALVGAMIGLATYLADEAELRSMTLWTLGSVGAMSWRQVGVIALCAVPGMTWLAWRWRSFDLMLLGEREAHHLGLDVGRFQRRVIAVCAVVVGVGVGFTGMIGFVGLVVPHLLRLSGGASHRLVLPGAALAGGSLLVGADLLARTVVAPAELPLGVVTALLGAPFFLFLLQRDRARGGVL